MPGLDAKPSQEPAARSLDAITIRSAAGAH